MYKHLRCTASVSLRQMLLIMVLIFLSNQSFAQSNNHSMARVWIEQLLFSIRNDFARPPVHSRNLFHISAAMHDAWAAYEDGSEFYFLGQEVQGFQSEFYGVPLEQDLLARVEKQNEAISFAAYRIIRHRFVNAPGAFFTFERADSIMNANNYDISITSTDYIQDGPAALGNYIAQEFIDFGLTDGSNETGNYQYQSYLPANPPIAVEQPGNPTMVDPNRWQPITLSNPVDQSGNPIPSTPAHLGPEWGDVKPFSLSPADLSFHIRDGHTYKVYHNPGDPPNLDLMTPTELEDFYKWNFVLVSVWQSHLDPDDNTMWDISPNSIGNIQAYPQNWGEYDGFYDFFNGGDPGIGYTVNPSTGLPYSPQIVKRADYARVLAEFWADGLDSETPPGHWFNIYNEVSDHPDFERKWKGMGVELSPLEYDVKAYLTLGGAMHDAAISAWSIKGWYDFPRAVSTIRYMADQGQSSNPMLSNFHPAGLPLVPGYVEVVEVGDPLAGAFNEHVDKIKLFTWKGPDYISDPLTDHAGVGWILAENWWPYQRPSFVSPPFAGYVSGHSTFSSAAAEVMSFITGSPYFPGGMSGFIAEINNFLAFEQGPSQTITLQWAKYKDASDQCSLSRIWGGIHPPVDDIAGRFIGEDVGQEASTLADQIVIQEQPIVTAVSANFATVNSSLIGQNLTLTFQYDSIMSTSINPTINFLIDNPVGSAINFLSNSWTSNTTFEVIYSIDGVDMEMDKIYISIDSAITEFGTYQKPCVSTPVFIYDTKAPVLDSVWMNYDLLNANHDGNQFIVDLFFSENCDVSSPNLDFSPVLPLNYTFSASPSSNWISTAHYQAIFDITFDDPFLGFVNFGVSSVIDNNGNAMVDLDLVDSVFVATEQPLYTNVTASSENLNIYDLGASAYSVEISFNKEMDTNIVPFINYLDNGFTVQPLEINTSLSGWNDSLTYILTYNLPLSSEDELYNLTMQLANCFDIYGNHLQDSLLNTILSIDTRRPEVYISIASTSNVGISNFANQDFYVDVVFDETMNEAVQPIVEVQNNGTNFGLIAFNPFSSNWQNNQVFRAKFTLPNQAVNETGLSVKVALGQDSLLNPQIVYNSPLLFDVNYDPIQLGISESDNGNVYVYPNPIGNGNNLFLHNESVLKLKTFMIINQLGQVVLSDEIREDESKVELPTNNLSAGIYRLRLFGQNDFVDLKFVIQD